MFKTLKPYVNGLGKYFKYIKTLTKILSWKGDNSVNMVDRVMGTVSYEGDVDSKQLFQVSG